MHGSVKLREGSREFRGMVVFLLYVGLGSDGLILQIFQMLAEDLVCKRNKRLIPPVVPRFVTTNQEHRRPIGIERHRGPGKGVRDAESEALAFLCSPKTKFRNMRA